MKLLNVMLWALFYEPRDIPKFYFRGMVNIAWIGLLGVASSIFLFIDSLWHDESRYVWLSVIGFSFFAVMFTPIYKFLAYRYRSEGDESGKI